MAILSHDQVMAAKDLREETLPVPEWGGELRLRGLSMLQLSDINQMSTREGEVDPLRATILTFIHGVVEPVFTLNDYDDLKKKSGVVGRVANRITQLSGVTTAAIEAAAKNFAATQSSDSSTS